MTLPSARAQAFASARRGGRPKTIVVWRCRVCRRVYDVEPWRAGKCECGAGLHMLAQARVRD